jgi:AcrR family transcriptional regulator
MPEQSAQRHAHSPLYRKLKPGPGRSAEQVLANQCTRLCGAMVQLATECGYERVTVRGLARLAGVSTGTFYKCFANVEECFVATYARVVRDILRRASEVAGDGEERLIGRTRVIFEGLGQDPKAAHLVLVESLSAGPRVQEKVRRTSRAFERLIADEIAVGPSPARMPAAMAEGVLGAALRIARARLLSDPPADVAAVAEGFARWLTSLQDQRVEALCQGAADWVGGNLAWDRTATPIGHDRQLLLTAVARLNMADGYTNLTVPAIRREAGVSRRSFDENFAGVADCFLAAVESRVGRIAEQAELEASQAGNWERCAARMIALLCAELAGNPELARLGFMDIFAPGRPGLELREKIVKRWARRLCQTAPSALAYGELTAEASVAASWSMARAEVVAGRAERLARLAPTMAFVVLAPAVGSAAAELAIVAEMWPDGGGLEAKQTSAPIFLMRNDISPPDK